MSKSRWPSWVPVPNKPTVSKDVKQHATKAFLRSAGSEFQTLGTETVNGRGPQVWRLVLEIWSSCWGVKCQLAHTRRGRSESRTGSLLADHKLQAMVYDILPRRKVPESDAWSVSRPLGCTCSYGSAWLVECCFTSTETVGLLGTGAQDVHLDFHTAPEIWSP